MRKTVDTMKKIFFASLMLFSLITYSQDVTINEVQAKNDRTYKVAWQSDYHNWIELKNNTTTEIDLSGWFLSDNPDKPNKWIFPENTRIKADAYLIVFMDGQSNNWDKQIYTDFDISIKGDTIVLSSDTGDEVHRVGYKNLLNDFSYGKLDDGTFSYMSIPSPNSDNISNSAFSYLESELSVSLPSGLYDTSQTVELSTTGNAKIYYTLDGSTPTLASTVYTSPINIDSSTILKAVEIESGKRFGFVQNRSYILGASHSLPIVLLSSDNAYYNSNNKEVIDGRVEFCFIETDGTTVINQHANFTESGKTSKGVPQLNGKVKASKMYSSGKFKYKMFPDKELDEFDSFLLRNSSQDWTNTHLRDAFISKVLGQDDLINSPFEAYRPAVLYVNAQYQGIINIREDDDSDYIKNNYDLEKGEFERISNKAQDLEFSQLDLSKPENQENFEKLVNFNEHITMKLLRQFTGEYEDAGGIWEDLSGKTKYQYHYMMHDFDATLGWMGNKTEIVETPIVSKNQWGFFYEMLEDNIKNNKTYKEKALQIVAAQINHVYNKSRTLRILEEMKEELKDEIPAHAIKSYELAKMKPGYYEDHDKPFTNITEWEKNMDDLKTNIQNRIDDDVFNRIKTTYNLDGTIEVSYSTSDITMGLVNVCNVKVLDESFTGIYFSNAPVYFTAKPKSGYRFVRWEGDYESTNKDIAPVFTANASIKAVFEKIETLPNMPVVNEVQGKNDNTISDEAGEYDDWIEIYNPTDVDVDLAGYFISDSYKNPYKWQIPDTDATKTTVPSKGFLLFWADKDITQGINHLNFKLKDSDQVVLCRPDRTEAQYVEYFNIEADSSYAAITDGSINFVKTSIPTPGKSNIIGANNTYTVTFKNWDGSTLKIETVDSGNDATAPTDPERTGYTFTGWDVDFTKVTSDLSVAAQYSINSYTVIFKYYDETVLKTETVEFKKSATAPTLPNRTGYTFSGWDVDFSNVTSNLTVTAQYSSLNAVEDITENGCINVYPNPVKDILYITIEDDPFSIDKAIHIFNTTGEIIRQINVIKSSNSIDISDLTGGVYFVKIGNATKKIIKE